MKYNKSNQIRAVYYARVSTEEERQLNALEKQCLDNEDCIKKNDWTLVDKYVDEGKSGTTTKRRDEYKRLCEDIKTDKFDIIVIKSQDRLMRNVMDWYLFVNLIITYNKKLFIYIENQFFKTDDALVTGIKAILAEEYSRELSKKLNNAHQRRGKTGSTVMTNGSIIGYDQVKGNLVINEEEAKMVRMVYDLYLKGYGVLTISDILFKKGYTNKKGNPYNQSTLMRMLKNEKYKGTMICNKYHKDFDTKRIIKNSKDKWYIHENRIPVIIEKEVWNKVQEIRLSKTNTTQDMRKVGKRGNNHILTGRIFCGLCGSLVFFINVKKANGNVKHRWTCANFSKNGRPGIGRHPELGCELLNLSNDKLNDSLREIIDNIKLDENYISNIIKATDTSSKQNEVEMELKTVLEKLKALKTKREKLLDKYLEGMIDDDIYSSTNEKMTSEYNTLLEVKERLDNVYLSIGNKNQSINNIIETIRNNNIDFDTFIEMIEKIVVYNDSIYVYLVGLQSPILIDKPLGYGNKLTGKDWLEARKK